MSEYLAPSMRIERAIESLDSDRFADAHVAIMFLRELSDRIHRKVPVDTPYERSVRASFLDQTSRVIDRLRRINRPIHQMQAMVLISRLGEDTFEKCRRIISDPTILNSSRDDLLGWRLAAVESLDCWPTRAAKLLVSCVDSSVRWDRVYAACLLTSHGLGDYRRLLVEHVTDQVLPISFRVRVAFMLAALGEPVGVQICDEVLRTRLGIRDLRTEYLIHLGRNEEDWEQLCRSWLAERLGRT